jgi:hypothetical protein
MCNRKDCDGVNTDHPWCGQCQGHTSQATIAKHNAEVLWKPDPPIPTPAS